MLISAKGKGNQELSIVITDENKQDILPLLTHAYRKGFDTIRVQTTDQFIQKKIKQATPHKLLGFELIEQTPASVTIASISEPDEERYDVLLQRIFFILKEQHQVLETVISKRQERERMEELQEQADRYVLFCRRVLSKRLLSEHEAVLEWELLTWLMHISHNYGYAKTYVHQHTIPASPTMARLINALGNYLDLLSRAFLGKKLSAIHTINSQKKQWQFGACYTALEKAKGPEAVLLSHVREQFRLIQLAGSPILGILLSPSTDRSA